MVCCVYIFMFCFFLFGLSLTKVHTSIGLQNAELAAAFAAAAQAAEAAEAAEATEAAEAAGGATLRRNHSALQAELYAQFEAQACAAGGTHT